MSAVQGGSGFPFFAVEIYKYFTSGEMTNLKLANNVIPDPDIRMIVTQVLHIPQKLKIYFREHNP